MCTNLSSVYAELYRMHRHLQDNHLAQDTANTGYLIIICTSNIEKEMETDHQNQNKLVIYDTIEIGLLQ